MEKKVEQIMKNYREGIKKIDSQYEVKGPSIKELNEKIEYEKSFIEKLERQGSKEDEELINRAKERLEKAKKEKEKKEKGGPNKVAKLKNSKVILPSGREVTQAEKDEMDKNDLKDKAIRELTQESKRASEELIKKDKLLKANREARFNFKYEFEKDKNGNSTGKVTNRDDLTKIDKEYDKIRKDMIELNKIQADCNKCLEEFKQKDNGKMKKFIETWNEYNKKENEQQSQQQPKCNMVLEISGDTLNISENGKLLSKEELKSEKELMEKYRITKNFEKNKKAQKNIDYALVSALEKIDDKECSIVKAYLKIIRDGKSKDEDVKKEVKECLEKLNNAVDITYKFDKKDGKFLNGKEKRIARYAKKMGIASLEGITEKNIWGRFIDKFHKNKGTKVIGTKEEPKALGSGNGSKTQEGIWTSSIKVENKDNRIEKAAQEQIGKDVQAIQAQEQEQEQEQK